MSFPEFNSRLEEEITTHGEVSTRQRNELSGEIDSLVRPEDGRGAQAVTAEISSLNAEVVRLREESSAAGEKAGIEINASSCRLRVSRKK